MDNILRMPRAQPRLCTILILIDKLSGETDCYLPQVASVRVPHLSNITVFMIFTIRPYQASMILERRLIATDVQRGDLMFPVVWSSSCFTYYHRTPSHQSR